MLPGVGLTGTRVFLIAATKSENSSTWKKVNISKLIYFFSVFCSIKTTVFALIECGLKCYTNRPGTLSHLPDSAKCFMVSLRVFKSFVM